MEIIPSRDEFGRLARPGALVAMMGSMLADRSTPVTVFEAIEHEPYAFLLESVEQGAVLGRYSFVGARPEEVIAVRGGTTIVEAADGSRTTIASEGEPFGVLRARLRARRPIVAEGFPPFVGGAVGMMAYDLVRHFERLPARAVDDLGLPDALFFVVRELVVFDHVRRRLYFVVNVPVDAEADAGAAWEAGRRAIDAMRTRFTAAPRPAEAARLAVPELIGGGAGEGDGGRAGAAPEVEVAAGEAAVGLPLAAWSATRRDDFLAGVERTKEYIRAGDAFQVVLSQRFRCDTSCRPFDVYRSLRDVNPSPYMFYLQFGGVRLAGSSPEILVRLSGRDMTVRPIAGTRPRGADEAADRALEADLLADAKERAEHLMLVDLGRNDLGRVAEPGSVRADRLFAIERYSHVMHIVSNVVGRLRGGLDAFDLLAATFPAGTVSGAPKIRAMEIIEELEPVRRGAYAGAVGYFSFDGNLDACITIRTALLREGRAYVQAGAGIVADSVAEREYAETLNKARALLRAIASANAGLD